MQSIAAIISFQILNVGSCVPYLQSEVLRTSEDGDTAYISRMATLEKMSQYMKHFATEELVAAGPSILGWSVILHTLLHRVRSPTGRDQENRELEASSQEPDPSQLETYSKIVDTIMSIGK